MNTPQPTPNTEAAEAYVAGRERARTEGLLERIQARVASYWRGAVPPENAPTKHHIVAQTVQDAMERGITEDEARLWAQLHGEPTIGTMNAKTLVELRIRLSRPGGAERFRRRLIRDAKRAGYTVEETPEA